jgi:hypothetical protein
MKMKRKALGSFLLAIVSSFVLLCVVLHSRGVSQASAIGEICQSGGIVGLSGQQTLFSMLVSHWSMPEYWDRVVDVRMIRDDNVMFRSKPREGIAGVVPLLCQLKTVSRVNLDNTIVDADCLARLECLTQLRELTLAGTKLGKAEFAAIANLKQLDSICLYGATFNEDNVALLSKTKLLDLSLAMTDLTDDGVIDLSDSHSLQSVNLSGTKVADAGIKHVSKMKQLRALNICETNVTDACVEDLIKFTNLETLDVCNTEITERGLNRLRSANPKLKIEHGQALISWR